MLERTCLLMVMCAKRALHARCTLHLLHNATFWFIETMIVAVYETPENTNENEGFDYVDGALFSKGGISN